MTPGSLRSASCAAFRNPTPFRERQNRSVGDTHPLWRGPKTPEHFPCHCTESEAPHKFKAVGSGAQPAWKEARPPPRPDFSPTSEMQPGAAGRLPGCPSPPCRAGSLFTSSRANSKASWSSGPYRRGLGAQMIISEEIRAQPLPFPPHLLYLPAKPSRVTQGLRKGKPGASWEGLSAA